MQPIILETKSREFVAKVEVPAFLTPPDVVIWGDRVFTFFLRDEKSDYYREAFAVTSHTPAPGLTI